MAFTPYKVMSMNLRDPVWPAARRGLFSESGGVLRGLEFLESVAVHLLLAENYNRTTTDHTTEAQSAQRL